MTTPPEVLYHYTNQTGLLGILSKHSIWATKIHYLNDSAEYQLAFDMCSRHLLELRKSNVGSPNESKIGALKHSLWGKSRLNICVTSFSRHDDLLSQWRAYAGGAAGFCLGFDRQKLMAAASRWGFRLAACEYAPEEQLKMIQELVETTLAKDFSVVESGVGQSAGRLKTGIGAGSDFAMEFPRLAARLKSKAFSEEAEWRLISDDGVESNLLSFRPGLSMLIPYFVIDIGEACEALLSIRVGPTAHPELGVEAVQSLLMSRGDGHQIDVLSSAVPYRAW